MRESEVPESRIDDGEERWRGELLAIFVVLMTVVLGWQATSPAWTMGINWDTAGYLSDLGRSPNWATVPWNSHFAVGQAYWIAVRLARCCGATPLDGIRLLNALALASSAFVLCVCALRLRLRPVLVLLSVGLYLTSWGNLILVFTWEDNVLFHPFGLAALAICIFHLDKWCRWNSIYAGLLVGASTLMSWQGAVYAFPVIYFVLVSPDHDRPLRQRLRDAAFVPFGIVLARLAWLSVFWLTARQLSYSDLVIAAFENPSPNFLPYGPSGWLKFFASWLTVLTHMGMGVSQEIGPGLSNWNSTVRFLPLLGAGLLVGASTMWGLGIARRRREDWKYLHFLTAAFLSMTITAAIYLDLPEDKFKRYDYFPPFLALAFSVLYHHATLGRSLGRSGARRRQWYLIAAGVALLAGQSLAAIRWNRQWHAALSTTKPRDYAGHGNQSWFAYMRELRHREPKACSFVFAFEELSNGRHQLEISASLHSELPRPKVIGAPPDARLWPRPLPLCDTAVVAGSLQGCEWVSPAARRIIAKQTYRL